MSHGRQAARKLISSLQQGLSRNAAANAGQAAETLECTRLQQGLGLGYHTTSGQIASQCRAPSAWSTSLQQTRPYAHAAVAHANISSSSSGPASTSSSAGHRHHARPMKAAKASGPAGVYAAGRASGKYRADPRQELTISMLQELYDKLHAAFSPKSASRPRSGLTMVGTMDSMGSELDGGSDAGGSWWSGLRSAVMGGHGHGRGGGGGSAGSHGSAEPAVKGLYMFGGVGCGKTMLMDLFVDTTPPHWRVVRTHFHDFMLDVHAALRRHEGTADPLARVADDVAAKTQVLALDEFFVTDVANAVILNRLFSRLWERNVVLVATSNRHPDELYKGGLQRDLFMPFIKKLKTQCVVHDMASATDYRRLAQHTRGLYFISTPAQGGGCGADAELAARFSEVSGCAPVAPRQVEVMMGRTLDVPRAAGKACAFNFQELCGRPVAAADYIALTNHFHTVALSAVPVFTAATRTEAYRFVTLVDVLYEHRTRLLCSAEALPLDLFKNVLSHGEAEAQPKFAALPDTAVDDNLGFAKDRTISRLTEMQSLEYLLTHAHAHAPEYVLALEEAAAKAAAAAAAAKA